MSSSVYTHFCTSSDSRFQDMCYPHHQKTKRLVAIHFRPVVFEQHLTVSPMIPEMVILLGPHLNPYNG